MHERIPTHNVYACAPVSIGENERNEGGRVEAIVAGRIAAASATVRGSERDCSRMSEREHREGAEAGKEDFIEYASGR
eukprot:196978-Pleurochrysis_carterae.AAC.2